MTTATLYGADWERIGKMHAFPNPFLPVQDTFTTGGFISGDVVIDDVRTIRFDGTHTVEFTVSLKPFRRDLIIDLFHGFGTSEATNRAAWEEMKAGPTYFGPGADRLMGARERG